VDLFGDLGFATGRRMIAIRFQQDFALLGMLLVIVQKKCEQNVCVVREGSRNTVQGQVRLTALPRQEGNRNQ